VDIFKEFVLSVSKGGAPALTLAVERGIDADFLEGEGKVAYEYLLNHKRQYGLVPGPEVIFGKTGIDLPIIESETPGFWIDELIGRRAFRTMREGTVRVAQKLDSLDHKGAAEVWKEIHTKLVNENLTSSKVQSLLSLGKEVLQYYDNVKAGVKGIPTPWPTMTDQSMGWWPEDLVLFAGRLGTGKTWTLLLVSHAAWKSGHRVLIASTEMNKVKMAMRFFSLHFRIPYDDLRRGRLGEFAERNFRDGVTALLKEQGIYIVGGDFDFSIDNVEASIEEAQCALTAVDGAYLIKNKGNSRHETVSNTFDDFKRIAKRRKLALVANTQFNRSAKKGESASISTENVGITDVAGWNADLAYGLNQSDDMRDDSKMELVSMKIREGRPVNITIRWDLERMDFSEIDEAGMDVPGGSSSPSGAFKDTGAREPGSDDDLPSSSSVSDPGDDIPF